MFGSLGVPELIFIFALALLIFGPRKLPEIGRTLGRGLSEFRKASTDLKRSINAEMIEEEMRQSDPRKILGQRPSGETSRQPPSGTTGDDPVVSSAGEPDDAARGDEAESPVAPAAEPQADASPPGSVPRSADPEAP